jgi:hypothetical protein
MQHACTAMAYHTQSQIRSISCACFLNPSYISSHEHHMVSSQAHALKKNQQVNRACLLCHVYRANDG